jgi:retron-type reverse transcriptase
MPKLSLPHQYSNIVSLENLLGAWQEFVREKRSRKDVQGFERNLMTNLILLHQDLVAQTYQHSPYHAFRISDPKPRQIHKATVRDRIVHRAIYRILYPHFHQQFIYDSYSCRLGKGTHKAIKRFTDKTTKLSQNNTKVVWVLKCDIRKFFASIDQVTLLGLLRKQIPDRNIIWLIEKVVCSFNSGIVGKGLPLGNLTSQLFSNVYLNELDQFMKHKLKTKHYLRYADDFVILNRDKDYLLEMTPKIADFLSERLKLDLHPNKVFLQTIASGVDFLGWVNFPNHRVLRTTTKRRMIKRLKVVGDRPEVKQSYLGMLKWGNGYGLQKQINLNSLAGKD